ncbi:MAG TPA: carboxypeptidase-like regulatory domain-containing protein [Gemmatimonadaceae bacterium]|nr:carboxypeptidase-like regulatory domain-containing protein [Gemmatimonadaceae bacterium]
MHRFVHIASAGLLWAGALPAQTADATVVGRVTDPAGQPVAGATVTATNTATGVAWEVRTNAAGRYVFTQLPLGGPYDLAVRRVQFRPGTRSGYELRLGQRIAVDFSLEPAPAELAPVRVDAAADAGRRASLGVNFHAGSETLARMPASNRNFTDLTSLAPTTGVQSSLFGQKWTSTDVRIDGAQARNMLRAGEFGAGPFTLSLEAIREFEVSATRYDVTQGRQGGGVIRAATRSGTNEWTGSTFTYYRGSALSAGTDYQGRSRSQREFNAVQWGASIGGPIVRDRAHIFLTLDRQDSNEPLFTGLVQTANDERALGIARDSLTRLLDILAASYGLDTTRAQLGRLGRRPAATTLFARTDIALNPRHRLTLTHDLSLWTSPLSGGVDQPITLFDGRSDYRTTEHISVATLQSTFASGVQNSLKLGIARSSRTLTPNSSAPRGFVRIQSALAGGTNGDVRVQFGGNRLAPDNSREFQVQLLNTTHVQRGNVLFTVGTDNALTSLETYIAEGQSGLFEFQSLADLEALQAFRYSRTLPLAELSPTTKQRVLELGLFAQGEWRVRPEMTLMTGVRWDGTAFLDAARRNPLVEAELGRRTDVTPEDWSKWQPRAELLWDVGGRSRDFVRLGAGRFAAQAPYYAQHNQLLNDGARIADITLTGANVPVPDYTSYRNDPSTNPGLPSGGNAPPPYVNLVDPGFRTPSVWKASASYQRRWGDRLYLTTSLVASRTSDNYFYADRNLRDTPAFTLSNEASRPVFVPAATIDAQGRTLNRNALINAGLGRVLELTNAGRASQRAAVVDGAFVFSPGNQIGASYTYNRAFDHSTYGCCLARTATTFTAIKGDPRDLSGSWGPSDVDFRHKVVVSGSWRAFWGIDLSSRYVGSNGRPFSAIVNGDINGDESTSNDLAFVFDPDDPSTPAGVATSMRRVLDNPDNVARHYLRRNLGRIAPRNGAFAPWVGRVDVRATKRFQTARGQWLEFGVDVFNFANLLNSKWGAEYQLPPGISNQNPVVQRVPLLNVVGFDQGLQRYNYTVNENFGVLTKSGTPYQLQLSARYGY